LREEFLARRLEVLLAEADVEIADGDCVELLLGKVLDWICLGKKRSFGGLGHMNFFPFDEKEHLQFLPRKKKN
jgi:hypothetical protein